MSSLVYLHNKNGRTYVYENISYWDKSEKKPKSKRKCIGHLDQNGKIVPNRRKGDSQKKKEALNGENTPECHSYSCGVSLLLDKAVSDTGLGRILKNIFPEDWTAILTCAYYLVSEGQALSRAEKWSAQASTPYRKMLGDQRISELLTRITQDRAQKFFTEWIKQNQGDEYYCMDITSVSSYSELNEFVSYGYNRDGEKLPQVNLLMASGHAAHIPLFYRIIPGSIRDVSTMDESLSRLGLIDVKRLHLVMDKGFYSEENIDALYKRHIRFAVGIPFTASLARGAVERHRGEEMVSYRHYCSVFGDELYADSELYKWKGHRCYLHTYFDNLKAALDDRRFSHRILMEYEELVSGNLCKAHQKDYERFFIVKETPKRGRKVEYNQPAIDKYRKNTSGWFVMATNDIKDPIRALEIYRMKDAVEKHFDDLKNDLDMKRLRIHSSAAMDGRIFIQYIALILSAQIRNVMNKHGWFKNHNMQEVIDEMKSLRVIIIEGKRKRLYTTLTAFQKEILQLFEVKI